MKASNRPFRSRRVRPFPAKQVTQVSSRELPPKEGGLNPSQIQDIWHAVESYYSTGLQPGMALCIRRHGAIVLERSIGHTRGNEPGAQPGQPKILAHPDSLFNMFSGSKCVTAMLAMHLVERGLLGLDKPVSAVLKGFGCFGKERITLRHLLTHRAGIPAVPEGSLDLDILADPDQIMKHIVNAKVESEPGVEAAYHAVTGGFVIAEMIRAVTGKNLRQMLQETICGPLGISNLSYGVSPERLSEVAVEAFTGPPPPPPLERFLIRSLGTGMRGAVELANDPRFLQGIVPSANVIGTAHDVGLFFELLLRGGRLNGKEIFQPSTVKLATSRQRRRHEIDQVIKLPLRYGLGFMLGSDHLSFYGPSTPQAYGHLGFSQVLAWADPERDISVAFLNNGKPFVTPKLVRWWNLMRVISATIPKLQ